MSSSTIKEEVRRLIDRLPEDAAWEDIQYDDYIRKAIEAGLKDSCEGRAVSLADADSAWGRRDCSLDRSLLRSWGGWETLRWRFASRGENPMRSSKG